MGLTTDPNDPRLTHGADPAGANVDQAGAYLVLPPDGDFVRPVRRSYWHTTCGTVTTMAPAIAETYARNPGFYGATYCVACRAHRPVGPDGEFYWCDPGDLPVMAPGRQPKVGT